MNPIIAVAVILGALGAVMWAVRTLQLQGYLGAESGRKLVHVAMGAISIFFPWLISDREWIWLLALLAVAALTGVRFLPAVALHFGGVLGGVNRASWGEIYFPLGVALTFTFAQSNRAAYCAAISVLALADSAGALIGGRYGRLHYSARKDAKSLEGSLAVLLVSVGCTLLALGWLSAETWRSVFVGSLLIGASAATVEGLSGRGLDNFTLPLVVAGLIKVWTNHQEEFQSTRLICLFGVGLAVAILSAAALWSARRIKRPTPRETGRERR